MHRPQTLVVAATLLGLSGLPLLNRAQAEPAAPPIRERATITKEEAALKRKPHWHGMAQQ